jgi:hypothetical protein
VTDLTAGQPGEPGQPGQPGGHGGAGGAGGRGGTGGTAVTRRRRGWILYILALSALIIGATAFTVAIRQAQNATTQATRTAAALTAEIRAHCIADATNSNRQRRLDLGLIVSDRAYLTVLHREAEHPAVAHDETLITAEDTWLTHVLDVRYADLPAYRDPARC